MKQSVHFTASRDFIRFPNVIIIIGWLTNLIIGIKFCETFSFLSNEYTNIAKCIRCQREIKARHLNELTKTQTDVFNIITIEVLRDQAVWQRNLQAYKTKALTLGQPLFSRH